MSLPIGYKRLEYIESTGTQWIDTKVFPAETRILIDAFILEKNTGNDHHIASAAWAEPGKAELFNVMRLRADRTGYAVRYGNDNLRNIEHQGNVFGRHTFNRNFPASPYTAQVDSAETITLTPGVVGSIGCNLPLFAFRRNNGSCSGFTSMRLYSCKIWKTTAFEGVPLIRDFIPCKNASGEVGLWDDVNSVFYGNAGTGAFIAGEIPSATHKTLVNGTVYEVKGGKCLVNGTVYSIKKGRTLIGGTGYDITFPSAVTMPVKGDLITMNLDGTDRLYRVLKIVDETTVEVFRVQTLDTALRYSGTAEYAGNDIDVALNQTYYNTLTTAAKNAIVPKDINQYSYANRGSYTDDHACALYYPENKWLRWHVGNRFVYTLDLEDVEEYFNSKYTSDDLNATFFQGYTISGDKRLWLRSASTSDDSMAIMITHGLYACVIQSYFQYDYGVLAAFQIDLSKIDFTIN